VTTPKEASPDRNFAELGSVRIHLLPL